MDYSGYAQRSLGLGELAAAYPTDGANAGMPLQAGPPKLSAVLRQIADVLELQEAGDIAKENALEIVGGLPGPLAAALAAMLSDVGEPADDADAGEEDGDDEEDTDVGSEE